MQAVIWLVAQSSSEWQLQRDDISGRFRMFSLFCTCSIVVWYWCLSAFNAAGLLSAFTLSLSLLRDALLNYALQPSSPPWLPVSTALRSSTRVCLMTASGLLLANESVRGMFSGRWRSYTLQTHVLGLLTLERVLRTGQSTMFWVQTEIAQELIRAASESRASFVL